MFRHTERSWRTINIRALQILQEILNRQAPYPAGPTAACLGHVLAGMNRHRGGAAVRMFQPVMAAFHTGDSETSALQGLYQPVAADSRDRRH